MSVIKTKKDKGFTLVELLAVIVILAIILVIAVPKIMNVIKDTTKASFESSAKMVAAQVENQYTVAQTLGKEFGDTGSCMKDWAGLNEADYELCTYEVEDGTAKVTLVGKGKFKNLSVCNGTRSNATATEESCEGSGVAVLNCTFDGELVQGAEFIHNQYTYRYKQGYSYGDYFEGWYEIEEDGWGVILTNKSSTSPVNTPICTYINGKPIVSTANMFYDSLATTIDLSSFDTSNVINMAGMFRSSAATSLDLSSFDTSKVTNMTSMFHESAATTIDLSSFNTSKVTYMDRMFFRSAATTIDLSSFNTSNVTSMSNMFFGSAATTIDLSSFNTSKVTYMDRMFFRSAATSLDLSSFDTSKVTNMTRMFHESAATSLDLSSFDTSKATNMTGMFEGSVATTGYARTQADADKFNASSNKPETLTFTLKPNS